MICRLCGKDFTDMTWDKSSQISLMECDACWFRQQWLFEEEFRKQNKEVADYFIKLNKEAKNKTRNKPMVDKLNVLIKDKK